MSFRVQQHNPISKFASVLLFDDDDDVQWFNVHLKADWKPA